MEPVPRTQVHTSDLSPDDFGLLAGKIVARTGLAGPFQLLSGTIDDYENQTQKPELVWLGGTVEDPFCVWVSYPGGAYLKLKWPTPSEDGFCQSAIDCIISDLEQGGGTRERYLIPELTGPDWSIASIAYGDDDTLDLTSVEGESLIDLMGELNGFEDLPEDWLFSIDGGVLVLSVPHGTAITLIELGSGLEVEFEGPSFDGAPPSSLTDPLTVALAGPLDDVIQQYEELLTTYTGLLGESIEGHAGTTEAAIETAYSAYTKVNVRWTDADGDPRVSYKDPVNGWYHPVEKEIAHVEIASNVIDGTWTSVTPNVISAASLPANAKKVRLALYADGSASNAASVEVTNDIHSGRLHPGGAPVFYADAPINGISVNTVWVKIKSNGTIGCILTAGTRAQVYVVGWSR